MNKNSKEEENQKQNEVNKTIMGMLRNSEGDLEAYHREYKKKAYSHSVTNMQQAVEKFGKSIIALLKEYNENDLRRKVEHKLVEFFIKEIKIQLDKIKAINPEMEQNLRKLVIDKLYLDFKKKFHTQNDLWISLEQFKMILKEYDSYEKQIKLGEIFMFESFPMRFAVNELNKTKDSVFSQIEKEYNVELTDKQKLEIHEKIQNNLKSGEYFQEVRNTLYIMLLLGYVAIIHSNLEKHQSSSRYDLEREKRYSEKSELVQILPLMHSTMKKMIDIWYYLIRINNPEL
ncbi:MAG: hypothetical protein ACTSPO_15345 [Candidatus Heimdallarchaeaceae archaeon]